MYAVEEWRAVPGSDGKYHVSNLGRVRGARGQILRPQENTSGGLQVSVLKDGKRSLHLVPRLVLEAFVGPCPEGMECCHLDDNPKNNRVENLRWDTRSANRYDRVRNGRDQNASKAQCFRGHDLKPPNLYPSGGSKRRRCRSCGNAATKVRRGQAKDIQNESDRIYRELTSALEGTEIDSCVSCML